MGIEALAKSKEILNAQQVTAPQPRTHPQFPPLRSDTPVPQYPRLLMLMTLLLTKQGGVNCKVYFYILPARVYIYSSLKIVASDVPHRVMHPKVHINGIQYIYIYIYMYIYILIIMAKVTSGQCWSKDLRMENTFLVFFILLGMCHGVSAPTPWCNVHRTFRMHHGTQLGQRKNSASAQLCKSCTEQALNKYMRCNDWNIINEAIRA